MNATDEKHDKFYRLSFIYGGANLKKKINKFYIDFDLILNLKYFYLIKIINIKGLKYYTD